MAFELYKVPGAIATKTHTCPFSLRAPSSGHSEPKRGIPVQSVKEPVELLSCKFAHKEASDTKSVIGHNASNYSGKASPLLRPLSGSRGAQVEKHCPNQGCRQTSSKNMLEVVYSEGTARHFHDSQAPCPHLVLFPSAPLTSRYTHVRQARYPFGRPQVHIATHKKLRL